MKNKNQKGLVTIIFILIMSIIATLLLVLGSSRVLLSIQRSRSLADNLKTSYQAESEINDLIYKLHKGYLDEDDFASFPITKTLEGGNMQLVIDGEIQDHKQILTVTSKRSFAVSKIQAERQTEQAETVTNLELVLALDCTGSMNSRSSLGATTTRMYEQKQAAKSFVRQIQEHPNGDFIHMGVITFQTQASWLRTPDGREIKPSADVSYDDIYNTIDTQFGTTRENSNGCSPTGIGWTNIGGAFSFIQDYFGSSPLTDMEKAQVLITDGEPTASTVNPACGSPFCENCNQPAFEYLACAVTPTNQEWEPGSLGLRNPEYNTFAITVLDPPREDVRTLFEGAIGADNYFTTTNAADLPAKLDIIFDEIISSVSRTTINRVIPVEQP